MEEFGELLVMDVPHEFAELVLPAVVLSNILVDEHIPLNLHLPARRDAHFRKALVFNQLVDEGVDRSLESLDKQGNVVLLEAELVDKRAASPVLTYRLKEVEQTLLPLLEVSHAHTCFVEKLRVFLALEQAFVEEVTFSWLPVRQADVCVCVEL